MSISNPSVLGKGKLRSAWHEDAPGLWAGRTPGGSFLLHPSLLPWKSPNDQNPGSQGQHYWEGPGLLWDSHQWLVWGFCLLLYTLGALGPVFGCKVRSVNDLCTMRGYLCPFRLNPG